MDATKVTDESQTTAKPDSNLMQSMTKSAKQIQIEEDLLIHKDTFEYDEDFIAMTVLCYLKSNTEKYLITPVK